jgi:hypothetical protein
MQALLTVDQLSEYLRKSVASIRSDVTRNPTALPPICRIPGTKRLLWRVEDVEQWLASHVLVDGAQHKAQPLVEPARRGRRTKAEELARKKRRSATKSSDLLPTARA